MAGVQGVQEFEDFQDSIRDIEGRVPAHVVKDGVEDTIRALKIRIVNNIRRSFTPKGGTLNSSSSPYDPGGENSTTQQGGPHISSKRAWNDYHQNNNPHVFVIQPDKRVANRAYWMERGTRDHGPSGDDPMYFRIGGMYVVMSDAPEDASLPEKFDAEPTEVEGVDGYYFFEAAVNTIVSNKTLSRNIERRWRMLLQEEGFEV
jgi:hypothetical protein